MFELLALRRLTFMVQHGEGTDINSITCYKIELELRLFLNGEARRNFRVP